MFKHFKFKKLKLKTKSMLAIALIATSGISAPLLTSFSNVVMADDSAQEKLDSANNEIDSLKAEQEAISSELADLQAQVDTAAGKIADITNQIAQVRQDIDTLNSEIDRVNAEMNKEYETMKLRIQFIYESGDMGLVDALLSAKDFGEFLAKAEYIQQISNYDRDLLAKFDALFKEHEDKKSSLESDLTRLASLRDEAQSESDSLKALITDRSASLNLSSEKQTELESLALQYERQIESERLAAEEAAAASQAQSNITSNDNNQNSNDNGNINSNDSGNSSPDVTPTSPAPTTTSPSNEGNNTSENNNSNQNNNSSNNNSSNNSASVDATELAMMAAIIECEAGNQPYEGRIAVGSVIMNRIEDPRFGNTLRDVLYAPWQFSPVMSGRFEVVLARGASETNVQAAREVLAGRRNVPYLYFHVYTGYVNPRYGSYQVIEDHIFYNY